MYLYIYIYIHVHPQVGAASLEGAERSRLFAVLGEMSATYAQAKVMLNGVSGATWALHGRNMGVTWALHGRNMGATWAQHGRDMGAT